MLGSPANGNEKFAMDDDTPDLGESGERRGGGGVFGPFGGWCSIELISDLN